MIQLPPLEEQSDRWSLKIHASAQMKMHGSVPKELRDFVENPFPSKAQGEYSPHDW